MAVELMKRGASVVALAGELGIERRLMAFIDSCYNRARLHSALGCKPPAEFEQTANPATTSLAATMSFFRHEEIYGSDVRSKIEGEPAETGSPGQRLDESPAGDSSAGCSPAEPTSASPAEDHYGGPQAV